MIPRIRLRCRIGWHDWAIDGFFFNGWEVCLKCQKRRYVA